MTALLLWIFLVLQPPTEASLGTFPLPPVVGMSGSPDVRVKVTPRIAHEPAFVRVLVTVERHAENRALVLLIDGDTYRRSSSRQLDGEYDARMHTFEFERLPGGRFDVIASVRRISGTKRATESLCIIPRFAEVSECQ
jgi:hypothetical protein